MKLNEAFERVVIINLPFKTNRRCRLERHLEEGGIVDLAKVRWERAICGDWTPPPAWFGAGRGAWGCLMSHLRVGQDAVHDKLASYCVLEDDVVFHPEAPQMLEAFMREVPEDWGQVYLGGQYLRREPQLISPWVMRPYNVNRTHAFALSKKTIPRYLQHIMHAPDYLTLRLDDKGQASFDRNGFHIDHQLGRAHERRNWKTYTPKWWLAGHEAGGSNISGRKNPRLWWHWRGWGQQLPFVVVPANATDQERDWFRLYLHPGNNLLGTTLVDIGLDKDISDEELTKWLRMIAGEAIERWKLPGFEVPQKFPELPDRVQNLWAAGICEASEECVTRLAPYPFNGLCGGIPPGIDSSPSPAKAGLILIRFQDDRY